MYNYLLILIAVVALALICSFIMPFDKIKIKSSKKKLNKKIVIIAMLPLLFDLLLMISPSFLERCCRIYPSTYGWVLATFIYYSIPFVILSLIGGFSKTYIVSIVGALEFLAFNIWTLVVSSTDRYVTPVGIISIVFCCIVIFLNILLIRESKQKKS